jgi:hypothetical protein
MILLLKIVFPSAKEIAVVSGWMRVSTGSVIESSEIKLGFAYWRSLANIGRAITMAG